MGSYIRGGLDILIGGKEVYISTDAGTWVDMTVRTCGSFLKMTHVSSVKWEERSSAENEDEKGGVWISRREELMKELSSRVEELMK